MKTISNHTNWMLKKVSGIGFGHAFALGLWLLLAGAPRIGAAPAPFQILDPSELRADFSVSWSSFATGHGTPVPDETAFPASDRGADVSVIAENSNLSIWNQGGLFTSGVLLRSPGSGRLFIATNRPVQGFGITIEHIESVEAEYVLDFFSGTLENLNYLGTVSTQSPGVQGNPAFLGMVDPEARIEFIAVGASHGDNIVVTDPVFQLPVTNEIDLANLPVAAQVTRVVSPAATYLHEGPKARDATPSTTQATVDNVNACDLLAEFPTLRNGDIIRFERIGISLKDGGVNQTLCVLSKENVIAAGNALRRVSGAVKAGATVYTPFFKSGNFPSPTNIAEDFLVGQSTFIEVPAGVKYAFFSLAEPDGKSLSTKVRMSQIPRAQFLDWIASFGLYGPLSAFEHDLDEDGLTLLEEYAFGKDPTVADSGADSAFAFSPRLVGDPSGFTSPLSIEYAVRLNAPLRYIPEVSSDLLNWSPLPASAIFQSSLSETGMGVFRATDQNPHARRFGRVSVEYLSRP